MEATKVTDRRAAGGQERVADGAGGVCGGQPDRVRDGRLAGARQASMGWGGGGLSRETRGLGGRQGSKRGGGPRMDECLYSEDETIV